MLLVKVLFTIIFFQILLFKGRLVLSPTQQVAWYKRVKLLVKNQNRFSFCWNYLRKKCDAALGSFEWFLFFKKFLNPFSPGKFEKFDF